MGEPTAPHLPKDAPEGLVKFLACEKDDVTLKDGELTWVSVHGSDLIPPEWQSSVPDKIVKGTVHPSMTIAPDPSGPGKATIKIGLDIPPFGTVGPSVPASIDSGTLSVDTSGLPQALKDPIDSAVKNLNDWFKSKDKGLAPPAFGKGQVKLSKVDLPAPVKTTPEPTPVPGPDIQKPTPPPPPPPVVPPPPQAAGTDWSHLSPTSEQWDKALQETKTQVEPPKTSGAQTAPKPVIGAGGPGGPKAPAGLGGVAINWLIAIAVVAVLGALGIFIVGPAFGLFGGSGGTPSPSPSHVAAASPTPTATPIPTPSPTPEPQVVHSSDGAVTLTIPYGSVPVGTNLTVTPLGQADAPPELAGVTFRGFFYDVGPTGATLTGPIGYERIIDLTALRIEPETQGYPLIQLAERTSDAKWSWLAEQHKVVGGPDGMGDETKPTQNGTLTTVGDVFGFSRGIYLHRDPYPEAGTTFGVGQPIRIGARITASNGEVLPTDFRPIVANVVPTVGLIAPGVVYSDPLVLDDPTQQSAEITATCTQPGDFVVGLQMDVTPVAVANDSLIAALGLGTEWTSTVAWTTSIHCETNVPPIAGPSITSGCIRDVHSPYGSDPSHFLVVVNFAAGSQASRSAIFHLSYGFGNLAPREAAGPISGGRAELKAGINSYGTWTWDQASASATDGSTTNLTADFVRIFGPSVNVTSAQGNLAGNACQ